MIVIWQSVIPGSVPGTAPAQETRENGAIAATAIDED
jgi:hypothetical protein